MTQHCFKSVLAEHFEMCPFGRHEQNVFKSFSLSLSGHNNHNGSIQQITSGCFCLCVLLLFCFCFYKSLMLFLTLPFISPVTHSM